MRHYVASLAERTETLAEVISLLADSRHLPAVFHCTAGKDRTGMVAALVLSLVGVADDVIVEDYTLTDDRMVLRDGGDPGVGGVIPDCRRRSPTRVARAEAASMETFLQALADGYGGAEGWARAAGLDDDTLASLRTAPRAAAD